MFSGDDDQPITASATLVEILASPLPETENALEWQRNRLSEMISRAGHHPNQWDRLTAVEVAQAQARIASIDVAIKPLQEARLFADFARAGAKAGWPELAIRNALSPEVDMTGPTFAAARQFVDTFETDEHWFLILGGKIGVGKTTAAAWVAARLWSRYRILFRFVTAAAFARSSKYDDARNDLLAADALCIDDMGAEFADRAGNLQADVDELINTFYSRKRPFIATTNLWFPSPEVRGKQAGPEQTFACRYGARAADRVKEAGRWILDVSPSKRRARP